MLDLEVLLLRLNLHIDHLTILVAVHMYKYYLNIVNYQYILLCLQHMDHQAQLKIFKLNFTFLNLLLNLVIKNYIKFYKIDVF